MDQHESSSMAHEAPSYPSPTGHQMGEGTHPFYSNQQPIPSAEDMSLQTRLSREVPPNMTDNIGDGQDIQRAEQVMQNLSQAQMHSPQQLAQGGLDSNHESNYGDGSAKKRTKVSRACDECRRKKIRCDATSESGIEQCTSCKRVGGTCKFSRVPMKRGPSKGYIKELADRLVNLENSIQPNPNAAMHYGDMNHGGISPRVMNGYSPAEDVPASISRKRTHSMSEGLNNPPYVQPQLQNAHERAPSVSAWSTQDSQRHLPHPVAGYPNPQAPHTGYPDMSYTTPNRRAQVSPNGVPPASWRRDSISAYAESAEHDLPHEASFEWDEQAIDEYYHLIHPTFPLLAHSKSKLHIRLSRVTATMREAFLEALYAAVRVSPQNNMTVDRSGNRAVELLMACQPENAASRSLSDNIVYLQAIILMTLYIELSGPAYNQMQQGIPAVAWLGMAVGLAYFLKLHVNRSYTNLGGSDPDSSAKLCRRTWWTLVTLDRWHAASTASPLFIPDTSTVLLTEDKTVLGESAYHLARLSIVLGHVSEYQLYDPSSSTHSQPPNGLLSRLLSGELDRFRESIDPVLPSLPIVHLAYWHVKTLVRCYTHFSISSTDDLVDAATTTTSILTSKPSPPPSPLTHHFTALAVLVLSQLADVKETRETAMRALHDLADAVDKSRILSPHVAREESSLAGWDSTILDRIGKTLHHASLFPHQAPVPTGPKEAASTGMDRGGLQHLADLAVGESEGQNQSQGQGANGDKAGLVEKEKIAGEGGGAVLGAAGAEEVDWPAVLRTGYLNLVA